VISWIGCSRPVVKTIHEFTLNDTKLTGRYHSRF
jgi:hypothetical protein